MKELFICFLLSILTLVCNAQTNYDDHFIAKRDRTHNAGEIKNEFLTDSLNNTLNKLELIEVWIDYDSKTYKIQSKKNDFNISGKYYALDGGTGGYRYYCYIGNSKQKITISTIPCNNCKGKSEFLELYGGDDFYVSFVITKQLK